MSPTPYDAFALVYDQWSSHMIEDVAWYVELAGQAEEPIVELAVGNGRVAIPIAAETGNRVIGIDSSGGMLEQARAKAAAAGVDNLLDLRVGDMRDFQLAEAVELVICPFRSLLHLPTWADRRRVFERVAASLRLGGRFAWNAFVFDPAVAASAPGTWEENNGVRFRRHHWNGDNRIDIELEDGSMISLWWLNRSEWEALLDVSGLETEALYGGFQREPFHERESPEFVWVARKPERS